MREYKEVVDKKDKMYEGSEGEIIQIKKKIEGDKKIVAEIEN